MLSLLRAYLQAYLRLLGVWALWMPIAGLLLILPALVVMLGVSVVLRFVALTTDAVVSVVAPFWNWPVAVAVFMVGAFFAGAQTRERSLARPAAAYYTVAVVLALLFVFVVWRASQPRSPFADDVSCIRAPMLVCD